jgi:hypothetical protein
MNGSSPADTAALEGDRLLLPIAAAAAAADVPAGSPAAAEMSPPDGAVSCRHRDRVR